MSEIARFSISIESDLLQRFLHLAEKRGWGNRSEALRNLIRNALVQDEWEENDEIVGTITLVYDHHKRDITSKLTSTQHDHHSAILSTTHIHLDHSNCLEMIAIRGTAKKVRQISDSLIGTRGVKHGKLTATTTGRMLDGPLCHVHGS